jgi:hypothetical protein
VAYALENAVDQWLQGERAVNAAPPAEQGGLERAVALVQDEVRRRLGSVFYVSELAELYGRGTEWAESIAQGPAGRDAIPAVDAAFYRYARQASDYAGGRRQWHLRED